MNKIPLPKAFDKAAFDELVRRMELRMLPVMQALETAQAEAIFSEEHRGGLADILSDKQWPCQK